ncbi:MAG: glycerol-3-phosphate O-acyltransferase [Planctomycetota bacterium]|jgi:glycerol-3-phosphate O-acyltransferase
MNDPITLPRWLLVLLLMLSAWAVVALMLLPGIRWWFRRRANRVIDEINQRLRIRLQPFKLTKREVLIDRLTHDEQVLAETESMAAAEGIEPELLRARVETYAREIVPSFNAYAYFRIGYRMARRILRLSYRVRLGSVDRGPLEGLPEDAAVVFVMNHRSNADYLLVSYLVADSTALSYAVGEWARIWPLSHLMRSMGAYFVRRRSRDGLYRKVLERYVAMATESGVTQAVFPEGGLTRNGSLGEARKGLLRYLVMAHESGARNVVFVPVGLNYDRVLEDRRQLNTGEGKTPGKLYTLLSTASFIANQCWLFVTRRWYRFGYAAVNFGRPLHLADWIAEDELPSPAPDEDTLRQRVDLVSDEIMHRIGEAVPALCVPLVAEVLLTTTKPLTALELEAAVQQRITAIEAAGGKVRVPREDRSYAVQVGLRMLKLRNLVQENAGLYEHVPAERALLDYYARSIEHFA